MSTRPAIAETSRPTGMVCLRCDGHWPLDDYQEGCQRCAREGHPANLRLDYARGQAGFRLPYPDALTLGEGGTPLIDLPELAAELGIGRLSAKLEWCNPTGSHKDRMSAQLLAHASARGAPLVVAASTGNGGLSVAAYAARAGIPTEIATTRSMHPSYRRAIAAHGAAIVDAEDSLERWRHLARRVADGAFAATNYRLPAIGTNPFGIEGYKALAAEIAAAASPDLLVVPCSRGDLLSGLRLGFEELGRAMPRLIAAEPFPRLARVLAGADYRERFEGTTAQSSIGGDTVTWQAIAALRASHGDAVPVADEAVYRAQARLATRGLHVELSAAAALAALTLIAQSGALAGRHAGIVLTGAGTREKERTNPAAGPERQTAP